MRWAYVLRRKPETLTRIAWFLSARYHKFVNDVDEKWKFRARSVDCRNEFRTTLIMAAAPGGLVAAILQAVSRATRRTFTAKLMAATTEWRPDQDLKRDISATC